MKCNLMCALWLVICALVLGADARANENEVAIADSIRKYKYYAKTARLNKEYDRAIGYYTTVLQYSPQELTAAYFLGQLYFKEKKDLDNARIALRRVVSIDSLHLNSNRLLYTIYQAIGEADSAALSLERVLLKKPNAADRHKLADLYRREGRNERAIAHYEQLVEAEREDTTGVEDAELIEILAVLHQELGQVDQALEWRKLQVEGGTGGADQLESIVELKLEVGDVEGAYDTLLELAKVDSQNAYSYYNRIASIASEEGDDTWRFKGLKGMVEADPKDLKSIAELVEWHQGRGEFASAKEWLRRGLKVNPEDAHLLLLKGDNLVREGDEEGAIAAFEKAKADPAWEKVAQQRIWQLRPPETEEEKLKRQFFGGEEAQEEQN
ncbi:MAG: tetratricopeptide repeat protein [Gemmatimonadetes bacterium]|nr:tetratricopeptide repeat protein [Gemmatimonadota bacterium]MDE2735471.1 tetratricopeptide repeat protein [Gemmatimonadota bacterium]